MQWERRTSKSSHTSELAIDIVLGNATYRRAEEHSKQGPFEQGEFMFVCSFPCALIRAKYLARKRIYRNEFADQPKFLLKPEVSVKNYMELRISLVLKTQVRLKLPIT